MSDIIIHHPNPVDDFATVKRKFVVSGKVRIVDPTQITAALFDAANLALGAALVNQAGPTFVGDQMWWLFFDNVPEREYVLGVMAPACKTRYVPIWVKDVPGGPFGGNISWPLSNTTLCDTFVAYGSTADTLVTAQMTPPGGGTTINADTNNNGSIVNGTWSIEFIISPIATPPTYNLTAGDSGGNYTPSNSLTVDPRTCRHH